MRSLLLLLSLTVPVAAATIEPAFDPTDCTTAIQTAMNGLSAGDTLLLSAQGGPWISGPLHLSRSGVTIRLEAGAELRAKLGAYPSSYGCLLRLDLVNDVTISGYGATMSMLNGTDPAYASGEGRHTLGICGSNRITVEGLTFTKAGGDGVYVAGGWAGDQTFSKDVVIRDCVMDDNRRQGVSVISAENLLIERCRLLNTGATSGTDPMSGIDFEPNADGERLVNCLVRDCSFAGNRGTTYASGIHTYLGYMGPASPAVDITIERCHITSSAAAGDGIYLACARPTGPQATFVVRDCLIEDTRGSGLTIKSSPTRSSVTIERCVLRNTFTDTVAWGGTPIYLEGQSDSFDRYGNITFTGCVVVDGRNRPFMRSYEDRSYMSPPLADTLCDGLRGTITVINPNVGGRAWNLDRANDLNVTLAVTGLSALPAQTFSLSADIVQAVEGGADAVLRLTRSGTTAFPWAADLAWAGTAQNCLDFAYRPGFLLVPAGATTTTTAIDARTDGVTEGVESLSATLIARSADYGITVPTADLTVTDVGNIALLINASATSQPGALPLP